MEKSDTQEQTKNKFLEVKTFPVPYSLEEIKENITTNNLSKQQIINQAFEYHSKGNILEAAKYYQHFINQGFYDYQVFSNYGIILVDFGRLQEAETFTRKAIQLNPNFAEAHSNLGNILRDLGKLEEAELSTRKAIQLNPNFAEAHSNLGNIFRDLGKLEEAELSTRKAIQLNPNFTKAYFSLSNLQYSNKSTIWKDQLFSQNILNMKLPREKIDIYFARSNILHKERNTKTVVNIFN